MYIEELKAGEGVERAGEEEENKSCCGSSEVLGVERSVVEWNAKRVLIGAGARALFYPTLLYNVVRNKIQPEFRWWDRVDEVYLTCMSSSFQLIGFVGDEIFLCAYFYYFFIRAC